jgi:hypothetical protein
MPDFVNQAKNDDGGDGIQQNVHEVVEQLPEVTLTTLFENLMNIQSSVNEVSHRQKSSEERLERLELKSAPQGFARTSHSNGSQATVHAGIRRNHPATSFNEELYTNREEESDYHENTEKDPYPHIEGDENQGIYLAVKDSVARIQLPSQLTLGDSNVPAKGETRNRLIFIRKSASYITTALKVMKSFGEKASISEGDLDNLYACLVAHLRMHQSEQSICIVEGTGVTKDCMQMFRFLSKNPCFTSNETVALENAARISVAASLAQQNNGGGNFNNRGRGYNRGNSNFRGRGRGNNNYHGKDNYHSRDSFDSSIKQANVNP